MTRISAIALQLNSKDKNEEVYINTFNVRISKSSQETFIYLYRLAYEFNLAFWHFGFIQKRHGVPSFTFKISFRIYNSPSHATGETPSNIEQDNSNIFESLPTHSRVRDRLLYGNGEKEPYLAVISGHSPLTENKNGGQNPPQADANITKIKILILEIKAGGKIFQKNFYSFEFISSRYIYKPCGLFQPIQM